MEYMIDKVRAFILHDCRKKDITLGRYYHQYKPPVPRGTLHGWVHNLLKEAQNIFYDASSKDIDEELLSVLKDFAYCVPRGRLSNDVRMFLNTYASQYYKEELYPKLLSENELLSEVSESPIVTVEVLDNNEYATKTTIERDADGKITQYLYTIWRRDKTLLEGALSREEMALIYRMYSSYGDNLTQATVSRSFTNLSLCDFQRILRAFNITKASSPFAPHQIEEMSEEEMRDIQLREKENSFLRRAEEDKIKQNQLLLDKYVRENNKLKQQLQTIKELDVTIDPSFVVLEEQKPQTSEDSLHLILYLSDMHLGATVTTGTLYTENVQYGREEAKRRLMESIHTLCGLGRVTDIHLVLLGDQIDCCGVPGMTARCTHIMPENMDPKEQINSYLNVMVWLMYELYHHFKEARFRVYSVPNGNHDGAFGYAANKTVILALSKYFPSTICTMWEQFYGTFNIGNHTFVCFHGGDERYHKQPFPLVLNDNTKVKLYEWIHFNNIPGEHVHFIKGDLHSSNIESCMRLDYRNVLSLFGASDYSSMNYGRNSYGLSYDVIKNGMLLRGDIVDM